MQGTRCFMFCWKKIEVHNGFIRSAIWHQSVASEEGLIVLDCLTMAYPEHFDWLKETVSFLPGKSSDLMSSHVGWNKTSTKMKYIYHQSYNLTCRSSLIIPSLWTWFEWGMLQTCLRVVNTVQQMIKSVFFNRSCLLLYKHIYGEWKVKCMSA